MTEVVVACGTLETVEEFQGGFQREKSVWELGLGLGKRDEVMCHIRCLVAYGCFMFSWAYSYGHDELLLFFNSICLYIRNY